MGVANYLFLACLAFPCIASAQDPREIVRKSVSVDNDYNKRVQDYTMAQKSVARVIDSDGLVKSFTSKVRDVFFINGDRYYRLIERDGKPLSAEENKKERETFDKRLAGRDRETEIQRNKRLAEREKRRRKEREFLNEIPDAFSFLLLPSEMIDGRAVWVIDANPRLDYTAHSGEAKVFAKFRGKLWIDKADYEWVKIDMVSIDTVSFGLFIARLAKGAHLTVEQIRLNDEVWLPKRIDIRYDLRVAILKHQAGEMEETMYNFRKFQADSRILSVTEQ